MKPSRQHDNHDSLAMMPWYPRDWRASTGRALMSTLARGIYRELLDAAWLDGGSLAADDRTLIAMAGCTAREWAAAREEVLARFEVGEDGRLRQPRLTWQYERAADLRDRQRKAAETANDAKRQRAAKLDGERNGERDGDRHRIGHGERDGDRTQPSPEPEPEPEPKKERKLAAGVLPGSARETPPGSGRPAAVALSSHRPPAPAVLDGGRPQNPLISAEQHRANQAEALELVGKIAALTGEDPAEVFATASEYTDRHGNKRRAMNPAAMSPERLALTLSDLRGTLGDAKRQHEAGGRQSVAEITEHRRRMRQAGGGAA